MVISLDMRGVLTLAPWVGFEEAEKFQRALSYLSQWQCEEAVKDREMSRC